MANYFIDWQASNTSHYRSGECKSKSGKVYEIDIRLGRTKSDIVFTPLGTTDQIAYEVEQESLIGLIGMAQDHWNILAIAL